MEFYGAFPHYIAPSEIIPLHLIKYWKKTILPINSPLAPRYAKIAAKLFPRGLLKYVSSSFMIIAKKAGEKEQEARIIQLLRKTGLLKNSASADIKIVKCCGRPGNYHTANFLIYKKNESKPAYFCKICRNNKYVDILEDETNNLKFVNQLLMDTELNSSIPKLLYFGTIDGITLLVTQFIEGEALDVDVDNIVSKNNLKILDKSIQLGIEFLVKFQKYTRVRDVEAAPYLLSIIEKQKGILKEKGKLTKDVDIHIKKLIKEIETFKKMRIPICAVHGDYNLGNLLVDRNKSSIVDFEHFEPEGLPFFDLSNLLFNPILMSYELEKNMPLLAFIDKYNLRWYIVKWLSLYAELSGMPPSILKKLPQIAALEQQIKEYPYYRDPYTYPMYPEKAFNELLSLEIEFDLFLQKEVVV